ncbi:MAG: hypothetical protein ACLQVI_36630 [Polyangiaceae bacterium]
MNDEKTQLGYSDESRGPSRRKFRAWLVTTILATVGTVAMSATARHADASPALATEETQAAVPLDQSDKDPPFGMFLGACNTDSDCSDGNTCSSFRKRGNHCTHACESGPDCTGTRCTNQHRCGLVDPVKTR